jgi:3'(2'), 5'-bisphosphate nucleotidase
LLDRIGDLLTDLGRSLSERRGAHDGSTPSSFGEAADRFAHETLTRELGGMAPGVPVVSEEDVASQTLRRPERYLLIDPIDGTASYCGGFTGYVTQLALMEGHVPVLAAIYAPATEELFLAERSAGATRNGTKLKLASQPMRKRLIDNYPEPRGTAAVIMGTLGCDGYVESGSLGLKICRIADQTAEIFFKDVILRDWDIAPAALVLEEAGGTLTGIDGIAFPYKGDFVKPGVIAATTEQLATETLNALLETAA